MHANLHTVFCQIFLQPFSAECLARALVRGEDFCFQTGFLRTAQMQWTSRLLK
jgi:hypothetical protein